MVRESVHPVSQVGRDMGTPDNVLYRWISRYRQAEDHGTTGAYELYVEKGCREGCTLEDWLDAEQDMLSREFTVSMIPRDGDPIPLVFHS